MLRYKTGWAAAHPSTADRRQLFTSAKAIESPPPASAPLAAAAPQLLPSRQQSLIYMEWEIRLKEPSTVHPQPEHGSLQEVESSAMPVAAPITHSMA